MNSFFRYLNLIRTKIHIEYLAVILIAVFLVFSIGQHSQSGLESSKSFNTAYLNSESQDFMEISSSMPVSARGVMPMQKQMLLADSSLSMMESPQNIISDIPVVQPKRRIQETHSIEMWGPNKNIKQFYELATSLCKIEFCYINNGNISINDSQSIGSLNLKIQPNKLDDYLTSLLLENRTLEIVSRSRSAQDRTAQYEDIKARKESQEALRDRLIKLVENYRGDKIQSLLEIERELARVQGQIESMDAQLRSILDVTDMTTVNLVIRGKVEYSPPKEMSPIVKAFHSSSLLIQNSTAKIITLVASIMPWIVLLTLIFFGIRFTRKFFNK